MDAIEDTERLSRTGIRCNTAAQQAARRRSKAERIAIREQCVAESVAKDTAMIEAHRRMVNLKTLCANAGIPWYVRMDCTADELEALLLDAAAAEDTEAVAAADDRAAMRADLYQF